MAGVTAGAGVLAAGADSGATAAAVDGDATIEGASGSVAARVASLRIAHKTIKEKYRTARDVMRLDFFQNLQAVLPGTPRSDRRNIVTVD